MKILTLSNTASRNAACVAVHAAPDGWVMRISEPTRNLDQNSKLWACLHDISEQVEWYGAKLTPENFKDIFTASLKRAKVVPGLDGGFVVLGQRTSRMTKSEFSELLELALHFGAEHGVKFTEAENVD